MADLVKASFDVALENPFRAMVMAQHDVGLCHRIGAATFPPKAVGVAVGVRFRDGIETEQVQRLHGPVGHRGNPEDRAVCRCSWECTPGGAVAVDNRADARRRKRPTWPPCVPQDSVHTGGLRTRITDDP